MNLILILVSLAIIISTLIPSYVYGQNQIAALLPMPAPPATMIQAHCIDFVQDGVCEYIVSANDVIIANPLISGNGQLPRFTEVSSINDLDPDTSQTSNLWIGIKAANINSTLAQRLGLNESRGVIITEATPGGPAQKAGLRSSEMIVNIIGEPPKISKADVILKIDNIPVDNHTDIGLAIQTKKKGDNVTLDVLQDGQISKITVTPIPKPDYLVYVDPDGLYSVRYPTNWTSFSPTILQQMAQNVLPPETLQNPGAKFFKPGSETSITIIKNRASAAGISDAQMESMADEVLTRELMLENGTVMQDLDCNKYKVEGRKACSYVLGTRNDSPSNKM
jgi:hypothetical protein